MSKEGGLLKCSCETKSVRNDIPIGLLWCYNSQNWLCVKELMKSKGQGNAQSCCLYENHFKFCYDWFYEIKQVFVKAGRTEGKIVLWVAGMSLDLSRRGENATWSEIKCNFELSIPCCWLVPGALLFTAVSFTKITFPTSLPAVQNRKKNRQSVLIEDVPASQRKRNTCANMLRHRWNRPLGSGLKVSN